MCNKLHSMLVFILFIGDNLIIGSYDKKLSWFDTELSNKPYQTFKWVGREVSFF